jgi:hypothetical protein
MMRAGVSSTLIQVDWKLGKIFVCNMADRTLREFEHRGEDGISTIAVVCHPRPEDLPQASTLAASEVTS